MKRFSATHRITFEPTAGTPEKWLVMLTPDGAAYTLEEWDAHADADWECVDGEWRFQGRAVPADGTITVAETKSAELKRQIFQSMRTKGVSIL